MNHSDAPNTIENYAAPDDRYGENLASRDIAAGEELTCNYSRFDAETMDKFSDKVDSTGPTDLGSELDRETQYLHPAISLVEVKSLLAHGLEATAQMPKGTLVAVWGGNVYQKAELLKLSQCRQHYSIQVEESHFLVPDGELRPADFSIIHVIRTLE
jgi:hypothetical protein